MTVQGENTDDGGIAVQEAPPVANGNLTDSRLKELFGEIESNPQIYRVYNQHTEGDAPDLILDIADRIDVRHMPRLDTPDNKLALADAVFIFWQKQLHEVIANTVDARGLTEDEALAEQERLIRLIQQNGQIPDMDKLTFAREHPVRGVTLGYVFNVARYQGTQELDGRIAGFTQLLEDDGENIVRIPKGEAIRRISYSFDHHENFGHVTRTRDVAWINDDANEPPELNGRIDTAIRKRSDFLIDFSNPRLRRPFELYQDSIRNFEELTGVHLDNNRELGSVLPDGLDLGKDSEWEQAAQSIFEQKRILDNLIEDMIRTKHELLVPISTIYYVRQYNHHLDGVEKPSEKNKLKKIFKKIGAVARILTRRS